MEIGNNVFLITGSASGLGLATARMIVENQGAVILADINWRLGQQVERELGKRALFVETDVTDESSVKNTIAKGMSKFETIHGAVNCAGIAPAERVLGRDGLHQLSTFARVVQVNLIGSFNVLRLVAEAMQHNSTGESGERGVIINTASIAAFDGQIGQAAYSASKGGIVSMTLPIAREFARFGIRVMTIAPGIFETPMVMGMPEDAKQSLATQIPFPSRLGRPSEYALLAKQIIENQMLNGEVIRLDGAIRMNPK